MKTDLSKYDNNWYQPGGKLKRATWFVMNGLFLKSSILPVNGFKIFLLKLFGANIGRGVVIKPGVNIKYPWYLSIGHYSWIGEGVWIDNLAQVKIGSHCCISQGALLLCGNHNYKKETFDLMIGPITLEDGAWVGAKSVVTPGVTLSSHSVLAVGSVATSNLDPYGIYSGNPATKVKEREIGA